MSGTVRQFQYAQSYGPEAGFLQLLQGVTTVPAEGPWLPCALFKQMGFTAEGAIAGLSGTIWFSNMLLCPLNGYTITIGGTITVGDAVSATVNSTVAGVVTISHTVTSGDTPNIIAAALATALNANPTLAAAGYLASEGSAIITLAYPTLPPGNSWDGAGQVHGVPATAPPINYTLVSGSVSTSGTETVAVGVVGSTGANVLTLTPAANHVVLATPARWVKAKVSALTAGPCEIDMAGVA